MKVPLHVVEERRSRLAELLRDHSYLPVQEVCRRLKISEATARRDLAALAREKRIIRTFGGALMEFNQHFASFSQRQRQSSRAKQWMARQAYGLIKPGSTIFFDTGTSVYALAERLAREPVNDLRVVTNSMPVADRLSDISGIEVFLLGGQYLRRQSALLGPVTADSLQHYAIDIAFLSAEGADSEGIWNSQDEIVRFQRRLLERANSRAFLIDRSKLGVRTGSFLAGWDEISVLVTDANRAELRAAGIPERAENILQNAD